jgi:hypothetical protein
VLSSHFLVRERRRLHRTPPCSLPTSCPQTIAPIANGNKLIFLVVQRQKRLRAGTAARSDGVEASCVQLRNERMAIAKKTATSTNPCFLTHRIWFDTSKEKLEDHARNSRTTWKSLASSSSVDIDNITGIDTIQSQGTHLVTTQT